MVKAVVRATKVNKTIVISVVAIGALIAAVALVLTIREGGEAGLGELPSMTLVYEVNGPAVSTGGGSVPVYKELRRLEYRSKTDWIETVIESPTIDLGRYGTGNNTGSYLRLDGNVITEYNAMVGSSEESIVEDGAIFVPNAAFTFVHTSPKLLGDIPSVAVTTDAHVCFNGDCEETTEGVRYEYGRTPLVVLKGDNWNIPLEYGDTFSLRSADIQTQRP